MRVLLEPTFYILLLYLFQRNEEVNAQGPQNGDNRCFLETGASSESFFVSEDTAVGGVVGELRVHGDPRPGGSISLRLQEETPGPGTTRTPGSEVPPVRIAPGTSRLVLARPLDKEGVDGPASVYVNVICERLRTNDPGFVIPVTIRVTDANDNIPKWVGAPYALNVSEVTVVGTRVLHGVRATDADQLGPFSTVHYSVIPGPHSDFFDFENPLEGTLVLRKPLDYETLPSFRIGLRAQDQGRPALSADTTLHVHVIDADDQNPRFFHDRYSATLPDPPKKGSLLVVRPRDVAAYDQDAGIAAPVYYTWNAAGADYGPFVVERDNGRVRLKRDIAQNELMSPVTLVVRATQQDNPDRYALATLTVSRSGAFAGTAAAGPVRFSQREFHAAALETLPPQSQITTLATNHHGDRNLKFYISDQKLLDVFSIGPNGELGLRRSLDYEKEEGFVFKVFATDGITNDSAVVNITVLNANEWEPRFRHPQYEFFVAQRDLRAGHMIGRVQAADGDREDKVTLSLAGPYTGMFDINSDGEIRLRELWPLNATLVQLVAVATDAGAKRAAVPVLVHFPPSAVVGPEDAETAGGGVARTATAGGPAVIAAFATILVLLAVVIALLVMYICKVKKPKAGSGGKRKVSAAPGSGGGLLHQHQQQQHEKLPPPHSMPGVGVGLLAGAGANKILNPVFGGPASSGTISSGAEVVIAHGHMDASPANTLSSVGSAIATARGGLPPSDMYTATVKSIMSRGTVASRSSLGGSTGTIIGAVPGAGRIISHKIKPAPSPPVVVQQQPVFQLQDPGPGSTVGTPVRPADWPSSAAAARAKKLSWGDDSLQNKTESDSIENLNIDVTTNYEPRNRLSDNTNLTVYF